MRNLLPEPPATLLPANPDAEAALAASGRDVVHVGDVAARYPNYSAAWAELAQLALARGDDVTAYAYARTGYHRGLDQLRANGWKGHGPVPWSHQPNRGFLRCLHALALAADRIGESDEAARCAQFLRDCDPRAADALTG
ncbi:MAG TPA: DUF3151 domain-containing protein [Micromonosporaceae bacterium]